MVMLVDNGEGKIVYSDDGDEWRGKKGGEALLRRRKKGQGKDEGKMAHEKGPLCPFKKANRKGK